MDSEEYFKSKLSELKDMKFELANDIVGYKTRKMMND